MQRARFAFFGIGVLSTFVNVLALTGSFYMLQIYDRVLPSKSVPTLAGLTLLLVLLYAVFGALDFSRVRLLNRIGVGIDRQLRADVIRCVLARKSRHTYDALAPVRDLDNVRNFLSGPGITAVFDLPWLPIYLLLIYMLHPSLGLFAACGAAVLVMLTALTEWRTRNPGSDLVESAAARAALGDEARRNADVIRAMGLEDRIVSRWQNVNEKYLRDQMAVSDASGGFGTVSKVMRLLLQSGVLGLGAYLAIQGEVSPGAIIAASIILSRCLAPVEIAIVNWKGFVAFRHGIRALDETLSQLPANQTPLVLPRAHESLSLNDVVVRPLENALPILANATFALKAGDGLGVIGPSGSGKSTLARVIVGACAPEANGGSVRLDGAALDQWSLSALGRNIGYMPQAIELFDDTIAGNIARFDDEAQDQKIIAAARLAGIHELILQLPDGYQTRVGDRGSRLSAGHRQRLALARALYGDPFLVVLDEPNSNLDIEGDRALAEAVKSVRGRGGIVIVVAHRPGTLAGLNKILAMSNGRVQSFGPKEEILRQAPSAARSGRSVPHAVLKVVTEPLAGGQPA